MDLSGKVAVVTGASSGIGAAIVELFAKAGAYVYGLSLPPVPNDTGNICYRVCDVSDFAECQTAFEEIVRHYGKIDILVNCAGITRDALTEKMSEEQFDDVVRVDLKGVWNLTHFVGPFMQKQGGGSIINISSAVGEYGSVGQANYAAAKAGVIGMTKTWAKEFARYGANVRVNAIAPGYTLTDMVKTIPEALLEKFASQTALHRLAQPEEIAGAALFLASDWSSYVTGTTLDVNGGLCL